MRKNLTIQKLVNPNVFMLLLTFFTLNQTFSQASLVNKLNQHKYAEIVRRNNNKTRSKFNDYLNQRALAFSYAQMDVPEKAFDAYSELLERYTDRVDAVDKLNFALSARKMELYGLSDSILLSLKDTAFIGLPLFEELTQQFFIENKDKRANYWEEFDFIDNYNIKAFPQNSKMGEYGLVKDGKGYCYYSTHKQKGLWKILSATHEQPYHKVYRARYSDSSFIMEKEASLNKSRTNQHVSFVDQKTGWIYITRNAQDPNRNNEKVLQIYAMKPDATGKKWIEMPFHLNNTNHSLADLVISPDRTRIVFASDMPGGYGKSDLYEAPIIRDDENGIKVGQPVNLGPQINTMLRDNFPRFSDSGDFYFSSEGHLGFGGLDIYTVDKNSSMILNLGRPINSNMDDFAGSFHDKWGSLSSNRNTNSFNDNIYYFQWHEDIKNETIEEKSTKDGVIVKVVDDDSNEPLPAVRVAFDNLEDEERAVQFTTDSLGFIKYDSMLKSAKVQIAVHPCGYKYSATEDFKLNKKGQKVFTIRAQKYRVGEDLGLLFNVKPIYFESNSYKLTIQSKDELDRVALVLKDNPGLLIELGAHTDSKGTDANNLLLSENRAKSVYSYLNQRGITKQRLKYKGFGESKLLNKCLNGVNCSDQEHQINRRTEYIISGLIPCDGSFVQPPIENVDQLASTNENGSNVDKTIKPSDVKLANSVDKTNNKKNNNKKDKTSNETSGSDSKDTKNLVKQKEPLVVNNEPVDQTPLKIGDADADGIPDYLDSDSDNDGISDAIEGRRDSDNDGLPNFIDKDSDNDGLTDAFEGSLDFDKDGKSNATDTDSDNDGILDKTEGSEDFDNDGNPNYLDLDSDNDGISDKLEGMKDVDSDNIPNYLDLDSDGDGLNDSDETGKDIDKDGKPNYLDLDSDNDGISDEVEGLRDSDKDGKADFIDTDSDEDGIPDKFEGPGNYKAYKPTDQLSRNDNSNTVKNNNNVKSGSDNSQDIIYRVQIKMSGKPMNKRQFKVLGFNDYFEYRDGIYYKYTTSEVFKSEEQAENRKQEIRNNGIPDAFVVKFQNGKRIN